MVPQHDVPAPDLRRPEAGTVADDLAAQRVLERNGFERVGPARRRLLVAGRWQDHVLFQLVDAAGVAPEPGLR